MKLQVIYNSRDRGNQNESFDLTKPAFIKHMAIAGMGYAPCLHNIHRGIGMYFLFGPYFRNFSNDKFTRPSITDPTEQGQFSNLVGEAIADFLSKRIDQSRYTTNYEFAMKKRELKIKNGRPDLIAFGDNSIFAIEAKGFSKSSVSNNKMKHYKKQSKSGQISVDFSIASVAYNLYDKMSIKYYDPPSGHQYDLNDKELLIELSKKYYEGLSEFIDKKYFIIETEKYQGENFYSFPPHHDCFKCCFPEYLNLKLSLILPKTIEKFAKSGISPEDKLFKVINEKHLYIDNDRVGIKLREE
jgi:hypothetical protein